MKLLSRTMGEIPLSNVSIPVFEKFIIPASARLFGAWSGGEYMFQESRFADGFLRLTHLLDRSENKILLVEDKPVIIFQLGLQHSLTYRLDDIGEMLFHEWGYNCYYTLSLVKEVQFNKRDRYMVLELQVTLEYLEHIGCQYDFVKEFLDRVKVGKPAKLARVNQIANAAMMEKARIIFQGDPARIDERAKELLLLAFDNQLIKPVKKVTKLTAEEGDKIYEVKDFLFDNLHTRFTQEEIAGRMNISVYQMRKGFQGIYGITAIELSNIERMCRANRLITKDEKKIWEIAIILGYESESSFLRAFKKHYGQSPGIRQQKS